MLNNRSVFRLKSTQSHYEVLGVAQNATQAQIKTAFLELSKKVHPDQNPKEGSHEKFVEINNAYMVLGKADSRKDYDMQMKYRTHPFFGETGNKGPETYNPHDPNDMYWKKDPFSEYGYQYQQMRREQEWRERVFNGQTSDPEQHPLAVWVRLPIVIFYMAFIYLLVRTYKNNPDKFRSRGARERDQLQKMEEESLRRRREAEKKEELEGSSSDRPYYVVKTR